MSVDKLVDSTQLNSDLTSVANAIRTKGGTSAALAFPAGFVSAVQNIPTGITPTGTINITQNGTVDVTNYASANVSVSGGGGGVATGSFSISLSTNVAVYYTNDSFEVIHRTLSGGGTVSGTAPLNTLLVVSGTSANGGTNITGLTSAGNYRSNVAWYKVTG